MLGLWAFFCSSQRKSQTIMIMYIVSFRVSPWIVIVMKAVVLVFGDPRRKRGCDMTLSESCRANPRLHVLHVLS